MAEALGIARDRDRGRGLEGERPRRLHRVRGVDRLGGGGERVDVWTDATRLTLDDVAFENAERRDYTWFAYPGFRDGKTVRYGDLAAHGEVRVARAAIPKTQPPPGGQTR